MLSFHDCGLNWLHSLALSGFLVAPTHFPCIIRILEYLLLQAPKRLPSICVLTISFCIHFVADIYDFVSRCTINPPLLCKRFIFISRQIKGESFGSHGYDKKLYGTHHQPNFITHFYNGFKTPCCTA